MKDAGVLVIYAQASEKLSYYYMKTYRLEHFIGRFLFFHILSYFLPFFACNYYEFQNYTKYSCAISYIL